jgi:4-hydroxy-tetrahydrodipicolinate synthase
MNKSNLPELKQNFAGIWTALLTPFNADSSIDWASFERLVTLQVEAKIRGLVISGTTGEGPTLRVQEKITLLRKAKALAGGRLRVMAGIGGSSTADSIELARLSRDAGADSLLVVTPPYNKPNDRGMVAHFTAIAESVDIPICLYHNPGRTAQRLSTSLMAELCQHPRISVVKESSGDLCLFSAYKQQNLAAYLSGEDLTYLPTLALGGVGCISVISNIFPREMRLMTEWWLHGDKERALAMHEALFPLMQALFWETNPCPLKAAAAELGLCNNVLRLPMFTVTSENHAKLQSILAETKLRLAAKDLYESH